MAAFGTDFQKYTRPQLYQSGSVTGFWGGLGILLAILAVYFILQTIVGLAITFLGFQAPLDDASALLKSAIIGVFPASVLTGMFIWSVSRFRGGVPRDILALRWPRLGWLGWLLVIGGFLITMYVAVILIVVVFQIDLSQFQMGPDGESEAQDLVKQGMAEMAKEPILYWFAVLAVVIGAPIGEELIFRGYMFSFLSKTRAGLTGATLLTSACWALSHKFTAPWFLVGVLFVMGIALSCLLIRFGSLWVTLICHGVWN
ncbi:MAG: type II CAAX endopeptidase family protein, partial [Aestuariivirga sp.]